LRVGRFVSHRVGVQIAFHNPTKFEPVEEQVSGNGDFAKRCRNCVVSGRAS